MKNIYITNKDKTQILAVDSNGDFDFVDINESLFHEISGLFFFDDRSRKIIRLCVASNNKVLYDSRKTDNNVSEISYFELLNILTVNGSSI